MERASVLIKYSSEWFLFHFKNNDISRWALSSTSFYLLAMTKDSCRPYETSLPFKINQWEDMAFFEETESWHNKESFLKTMSEKKLSGENCVTLVLDNKLAFINFFGLNSKQSFLSDVGIKVLYPANTATQYSAYIHPQFRGKGIYRLAKKFISNYLFENTNTRLYVGAVRCDNRAAHKGQIASGLHSVARLERSCRFGRVTKSVFELHPDYSLQPVADKPACWQLELTK